MQIPTLKMAFIGASGGFLGSAFRSYFLGKGHKVDWGSDFLASVVSFFILWMIFSVLNHFKHRSNA